ncbi:TPA: hypothetical protein ACUUA8_005261 [Pseudomonas aeruginosa]
MQQKSQSLEQTGKQCAKQLALIVTGSITALTLIAAAIDNREAIADGWRWTMWAVSMGGRFWAAAALAFLGLILGSWAGCVLCKLSEVSKDVDSLIGGLLATGGIAWILGCCALGYTFDSFSELSIYGMFAVFFLTLPAMAAVLIAFAAFMPVGD